MLPVLAAIRRLQSEPVEDAPRPFGTLLCTEALHDQRRLAQVAFRLPVDRKRDDLRLAGRGHAERTTLRRLQALAQIEGAAQPRQIGLQRRDVLAELIRRCEASQRFECRPRTRRVGIRQHGLACLGQGVLGVAIIDQTEVWRKRGLQREAPQQRLAEGVDGADAHAARQVQDLRKQRAGVAEGLLPRFDGECAQFAGQRRVVQRDPFAEGLLQTHRHLGGGGLGEGQALDALGLGAGQHQAQEPVGQQLGLARSRRGTDERGYRWVGG